MATVKSSSGSLPAFLLDLFQRAVNDALCNRLLAAFHDHVHELGQLDIAELGIRQDFTFGDFATTWHFFTSFASVGGRSISDTARAIRPHLLDPRRHCGSLRCILRHAAIHNTEKWQQPS
jgi:hypothetical protein